VAVESRAVSGNYPHVINPSFLNRNSSATLALALAAIIVIAPRGSAQHEDHAVMRDMPGDTLAM
jgi:hypothetical protein